MISKINGIITLHLSKYDSHPLRYFRALKIVMKISISIVLYGKKEYLDAFMLWLQSTRSLFAEFDISINLAISTIYSSFVTKQLKNEFNISRLTEFEELNSPHHSINMLYRYMFLAKISPSELMLFRDIDALF